MAGSKQVDSGGRLIRELLFDAPPEPGVQWSDAMDDIDGMVDAESLESATGIPTHAEQVDVPIKRVRNLEMDNIPIVDTKIDEHASTAKIYPKDVWTGLLPDDMNAAWYERFQRLNPAGGKDNAVPVLRDGDIAVSGERPVDFNISGNGTFSDSTGVYTAKDHNIFMNAESLPDNDITGEMEYVGDHVQVARHELFHSLVDSLFPEYISDQAKQLGMSAEEYTEAARNATLPVSEQGKAVRAKEYMDDMDGRHTLSNLDPNIMDRIRSVNEDIPTLLNFEPTVNQSHELRNAIMQLKQQEKVRSGKDIGASRELSDTAFDELMGGELDWDEVFLPYGEEGATVLRSDVEAAVGPQEGNLLHGYEHNRGMIKEIYENGNDEVRQLIKDMFYLMGDNRKLLNGLTEGGESYG